MWQRNEFASNGVREFTEKGEAWTLMKEVETAGERIQSVYGILSAPAVVGGTGQMNTEFEVFARHSYVSHCNTWFPNVWVRASSISGGIILRVNIQYITRWCGAFICQDQRAKELFENVAKPFSINPRLSGHA